jgi:hypothetical protein
MHDKDKEKFLRLLAGNSKILDLVLKMQTEVEIYEDKDGHKKNMYGHRGAGGGGGAGGGRGQNMSGQSNKGMHKGEASM